MIMYCQAFFILTQNENRLREKITVLEMKKMGKPSHAESTSEEFAAVEEDHVCTALIMADKGILKFVQISKNIIDADSDDKNYMNYTASVQTSSEKRNIMKSMRLHSKGEINNKMADIEQLLTI
ncbi:hypothetical protein TNCV_333211 [Trichonephila clavipes]|nr:hypothetical protein TNCV_333211 [Trichonephila clavipes]